MWGYPVQDLAVAVQGLMLAKPDAFKSLQRALREGYESRCEWPEGYVGQIDAFWVGRVLWAANYVAQFDPAHFQAHVNGIAPQLAGFLKTGLLSPV
jgi:hypothetical protein